MCIQRLRKKSMIYEERLASKKILKKIWYFEQLTLNLSIIKKRYEISIRNPADRFRAVH